MGIQESYLRQLINEGEMNKRTDVTYNNTKSSRSHTVLQLILESSIPGKDVKVSRLNLVDLAGSEKASDIQRQKEGSFINRSLLALGTVIYRLTSQEIDLEQHIPFRDSKLTRLLQPSLISKSKISLIATLNPDNLDESINTLKFASRVKTIIPRPEVYQFNEKALLQNYKSEVETLKLKLLEFNQTIANPPLKLPENEKAKYEEKLEESRLASIRLKERIGYLTKLILTSNSVSGFLPLGNNQNLPHLFSRKSYFPISALWNPLNKVSSMPSLFSWNDPALDTSDSEDLLRKKLNALVSFIRSMKKEENKLDLESMIDSFQLDAFIERKSSIPDLKLEAALKKIHDLKKEKNELEIVLMDNARKINELKSLVEYNEKQMNEMAVFAKDQQELIEDICVELEEVKLQYSEYRELVGQKRGSPF